MKPHDELKRTERKPAYWLEESWNIRLEGTLKSLILVKSAKCGEKGVQDDTDSHLVHLSAHPADSVPLIMVIQPSHLLPRQFAVWYDIIFGPLQILYTAQESRLL
jgi:hypothetical protein